MLNKTRLLTPGPTPLPEQVRLALAQDMIHHRKSDFMNIMQRVQGNLRTLFGTEQAVLPLSCSGTGAMTAAVYSLFSPGERVLVINGGKFGERWRDIARMRGLDVKTIDVEWGKAVEAADVIAALDADPAIRGVFIQLSETSTGVLHPVQEVAAVTRQRDLLLVVDGVSAVSISPCPMDAWGIDCLVTGSQKGLMLPPGLALLALSPRAWKRAEELTPGCFYFNLPKERDKLLKGQTLFTSPINLIVGLDVSLGMLLKDGLEAVYRKQWALTMLTRTALEVMGLELLARDHFTWGITSVKLPEGVDGVQVVKLAAEKYGVMMAGGQDKLKGRIVRVGHMGWVDWSDVTAGLYALNRCLAAVGGYSGARDYLEQGLDAYERALEVAPGTPILRHHG
ncbi:alanine--glyoxylate aminotransferase family protein [uncultured Desulfovibrio sp.]|uniref:pyridoxal-phosphate-dependent aminotransferase family protein n=1 Tax=uncultured Desulfovibrio sp. TaxID=167968 RepID=UPI002611C807|nr:alanine--glyoxylate aminotransferase family protein [uncultured Desulfovibrio sp.]